MNQKLDLIYKFLFENKGIDILKFDPAFLLKVLRKRMEATQSFSAEAYFNLLKADVEECDCLLSLLHNSYSEFFRNSLTFGVLEKIVLPSLISAMMSSKKHPEIRIWSAACAGGQEIYSLAILLNELNAGRSDKFNFRIFATDISKSNIAKARSGEYTRNELNFLPVRMINEWFTANGDSYVVKPELKRGIDFSVFDLFTENCNCPPESIYGDFNLVFCANILFYYKPDFQAEIIQKIRRSLVGGGILITSETEREIILSSGFVEVIPQSAIFQV